MVSFLGYLDYVRTILICSGTYTGYLKLLCILECKGKFMGICNGFHVVCVCQGHCSNLGHLMLCVPSISCLQFYV